MNKIFAITVLLFFLSPMVFADGDIEAITAPITKIYDLVKAIASIVGVIAITIAGGVYMLSGNNLQQRDNAKSMVSYSIVGLILVWAAPLLVNYLTAVPGA